MVGDYENLEAWELVSDDWHDNADEITLRGRKAVLEGLFNMESYD